MSNGWECLTPGLRSEQPNHRCRQTWPPQRRDDRGRCGTRRSGPTPTARCASRTGGRRQTRARARSHPQLRFGGLPEERKRGLFGTRPRLSSGSGTVSSTWANPPDAALGTSRLAGVHVHTGSSVGPECSVSRSQSDAGTQTTRLKYLASGAQTSVTVRQADRRANTIVERGWVPGNVGFLRCTLRGAARNNGPDLGS